VELEDNWHHIYCDSYFSGVPTAEAIDDANQKFTICCQANRPTFLFSKCLHYGLDKKGDINWSSHPTKEILALSWRDNSRVNILTNAFSQPKTILKCKVKNLGQKRVTKIKSLPDVVADYRVEMGCVDRANARSNRYRFPHRVRKWPRAAFFGLLQMVSTNSWLIFKNAQREPDLTRKNYLKKLITAMAHPIRKRKRSFIQQARPGGVAEPARLHVPVLVVRKFPRDLCQVC